MFCSNCGKQIPDGSKFCPECGAKQDTYSPASSLKKPAVNENMKRMPAFSNLSEQYDLLIRWFMVGSAVMVLIAAFMPILKLTVRSFFSVNIRFLTISDIADESSASTVLGLFIMAEICDAMTFISGLLKDKEKVASGFGISTFVFTLFYVISLQSYEDDEIIGDVSISAGPIIMMIFSIVLLVLGILCLIKKKVDETGRS